MPLPPDNVEELRLDEQYTSRRMVDYLDEHDEFFIHDISLDILRRQAAALARRDCWAFLMYIEYNGRTVGGEPDRVTERELREHFGDEWIEPMRALMHGGIITQLWGNKDEEGSWYEMTNLGYTVVTAMLDTFYFNGGGLYDYPA